MYVSDIHIIRTRESTQRVQTSANDRVLYFPSVKLRHGMDIELITKVVGVIVLTHSEYSIHTL